MIVVTLVITLSITLTAGIPRSSSSNSAESTNTPSSQTESSVITTASRTTTSSLSPKPKLPKPTSWMRFRDIRLGMEGGNTTVTSVVRKSNMHLFVGGMTDVLLFKNMTDVVTQGNDGFICSIDIDASVPIWCRIIQSLEADIVTNVAVTQDGTIVCAIGALGGPVASESLFHGGDTDAFVACFNSSTGNQLWLRLLGSKGSDVAMAISVLDTDNEKERHLLVTGAAGGSIESPSVRAGLDDDKAIFIAEIEVFTGNLKWVDQDSQVGDEIPRSMIVDEATDSIFLAGSKTRLSESTDEFKLFDAFVQCLKLSSGTEKWKTRLATVSQDHGISLHLEHNQLLVTGSTKGLIDSRKSKIPDTSTDFYTARLSPTSGEIQQVSQIVGEGINSLGTSITLFGNHQILVGGMYDYL